MGEIAFDSVDIDSVAVEPDYCHRCGTELDSHEWEGREVPWCTECEVLLSRNPVGGAHVVVHDDENVLVLDEPIPQHEGLLSLPGGYGKPGESPGDTVVRELAEETGLRADPADLRLVNVVHGDFPHVTLWLLTYALERSATSGEMTPEADGFEAAFRPLAEIRAAPDRIRESDLERIELTFDG